MREIEFRGKRIDNGEWVYGSLITAIVSKKNKSINTFIKLQDAVETNLETFVVKPESIGQFTGLLDKNGNKIFEGDILKSDIFDSQEFTLEFISGSFNGYTYGYLLKNEHFNRSEIIGNIHENGDK